MTTSQWSYDSQLDCYVDKKTGMRATLSALLKGQSQAEIDIPAAAVTLHHQAQKWSEQRQIAQLQPYRGQPAYAVTPPSSHIGIPESEIGWLKRRVNEVCWRG